MSLKLRITLILIGISIFVYFIGLTWFFPDLAVALPIIHGCIGTNPIEVWGQFDICATVSMIAVILGAICVGVGARL